MFAFLSAISDHLEELRNRIVRILVIFFISIIAGFAFAEKIINYLLVSGPAHNLILSVFSPWDAIQVYVQISGLIAMIVSLPFALLQIWLFIRPGLSRSECRTTLKYIPLACILFIGGIAFGYFVVFYMAFNFASRVTDMLSAQKLIGISQYFTFLFNIVFPVALLFEMPVITLFLTKLKLLTPMSMKKVRRYAYIVLVIIGVTVTPPDFISDFLLIIPLLSLYELSILFSKLAYCKIEKKELEKAACCNLTDHN